MIDINNYFQESKQYKQDINDSISTWLSEYNGEPYGNEQEGRSSIVWKLIKKQSEVLIANLSKPFITGQDIVKIKPVTKYDVIKAKLDERLINHYFTKEFDNVSFIKTLTRVLVKEGTAFIKTEWHKEERKLNVNGQVFKRVIANRPYSEVIPNEDVFTDPLAYSLEDSRYFIVRTLTSEEELQSNPILNQKKISEFLNRIDSTTEESDDLHNRNLDYISEESEDEEVDSKLFLYECWYKEKGIIKIKYFLNNNDEALVVGSEDTELTEYPFINIQLFNNEFSLWGNSLPDMISDEQKFMTAIIRGVIDNMSLSNNGTKFIKKGALDSTNYNRLMEGSPVVEINTTSNLRDVMVDGSFNELPSSVYNMLQVIENQAQGLTGINNAIAGMSGKDINSPATNFSAVMNQAQVRLLDFIINIKQGLKIMFVKWLKMIYKYVGDEEIFKITGMSLPELKTKETMKLAKQFGIVDENGNPTVPQDTFDKAMVLIAEEVENIFSKEDIIYDIEMEVGTDGLKTIEVNQINMLLQQIAPLVGSGSVPYEVLSTLVARMFYTMGYPKLADEILSYKPQPDPTQQQMTQIQMQQELAKAKKEEALAQNALARTQATMVKAKKEEMKIEPEISDAYLNIAERAKQIKEGNKNEKQR